MQCIHNNLKKKRILLKPNSCPAHNPPFFIHTLMHLYEKSKEKEKVKETLLRSISFQLEICFKLLCSALVPCSCPAAKSKIYIGVEFQVKYIKSFALLHFLFLCTTLVFRSFALPWPSFRLNIQLQCFCSRQMFTYNRIEHSYDSVCTLTPSYCNFCISCHARECAAVKDINS